jgi:hypothetical protein
MRACRYFIILFVLMHAVRADGQSFKNTDYTAVDNFARTVKDRDDITALTRALTSPYHTDLLKSRAIFIWVTENIKYDYKSFNKGKEETVPACKSNTDCRIVFNAWEEKYLKKILTKKKAVCDGYTRLYQKMCDLADIRCEIITGYTKTKPYQIGTASSVNHAWNAVWIDSAFYFADPTWAAGYCTEDEETDKLTGFIKAFDNYYWLTPFHDLARNHYPKYSNWVSEPGYTKEKFANNPWFSPAFLSKINLLSPTTGMILAEPGDTIHFRFNYSGALNQLQVNSNIFHNPSIYNTEKIKNRTVITIDSFFLKKQKYIDFKKTGDLYEFDYAVSDPSLYYIEILFNFEKAMRFKVKVEKKDE